MKRKQLIRKILAWVSVTAILLSGIGCSKAPQVDISEKTNTERLEEAAVMTFSTTAATQLVAEDKPTLTEAEVVNDTAIIPYSPLYDLLGASTHYDVELKPVSDIVKITVDAESMLINSALRSMGILPEKFLMKILLPLTAS